MKTTPLVLAALGALSAGSALAAVPLDRTNLAAAFDRLDLDRNGLLSPSEAAADPDLSHNWRVVDRNADGYIDRAELAAFVAGSPTIDQSAAAAPITAPYRAAPEPVAPEGEPAAVAPRHEEVIVEGRMSDSPTTENDPHGYLPHAPAASPQAVQKLNERESGIYPAPADQAAGYGATPGADQRTAAEARRFEALDTNRDGVISYEEARRDPQLSRMWGLADTNRDNAVDMDELSAFEQRYGDVPQ